MEFLAFQKRMWWLFISRKNPKELGHGISRGIEEHIEGYGSSRDQVKKSAIFT